MAMIASIALVGCENTNSQQGADTASATTEQAVVETPEAQVAYAYTVDPTSVVEWVGSKPAGKHHGTVNVTSGGVNVENGAITKAEFVLDMGTITVLDLKAGDGKEALEAHLKGTDPEKVDHFFNIKEYPTASFVFKSFDGKNLARDLTVKGNAVEISSEPFKINRVDFGVNYGSKSVFDDLKDKFINDDIELVVKAKATK